METKTASLETLVRQAQSGSEQAFHSLYDMLADRVFLFVRSRTKERDDALDILQDVFLDFWRNIRKFTYASDSKLYAYLYIITRRKLAKYYEEKRVQQGDVSVEDIEEFLPDTKSQSQEGKNDILDIRRSLERVDQKDREVIELRYFSGLPFADMAALLNEDEGTLKVRNHRAIEKLRSLLHIQ